nr:unnamed protein product [Spirometra erinaceieuropaei]
MTRGDYHRAGGNSHNQGNSHYYSSSFGSESHSYHGTGGAQHHTSHGGGHFGGGGHGAMDATFIWKLSKLGRIGSSRLRFDDDFADRLNYQFSGVLMFLFIGVIGIRQYVGKPIQCWIPQEFTRGWEEYAENYCWVASTYFSPLDKRLPSTGDRSANLIVYYQWAPILMAIQALLFYLPCLIWRLFYCHSGFNVRRIMQMANDSNILLPEHGFKNVRFIARYMESCIYRQRDYKNRDCGRRDNNARSSMAPANFPYQTSYRMGLQQFPVSGAGPETQFLATSERPEHGLPPPQYSKSVTESATPETRGTVSRPMHHRGIVRSNGEATGSLSLSRRHKSRNSLYTQSNAFCH